MNQYSDIANYLRWAILLLGLTCLATGLFWIGGELLFQEKDATRAAPMWFISRLTGGEEGILEGYYDKGTIFIIFFLGVVLFFQWLFLRPRQEWRVSLAETGRPMKTAVAAAAFMAMLLSVGLILTLLEIYEQESWGKILVGLFSIEDAVIRFYTIMIVLWVLWALVFYIYWRQGERITQLGKMISGLIAGSFLELFVAIGVYAWDRHAHGTCLCERGSYTGLVFGATVMIWAFGPGLLILFLKKQRDKRLRQEGHKD